MRLRGIEPLTIWTAIKYSIHWTTGTSFKNERPILRQSAKRSSSRKYNNYFRLWKITKKLNFGWKWEKELENSFKNYADLKTDYLNEKQLRKSASELITHTKYLILPFKSNKGVIANRFLRYLDDTDLNPEQRNQAFLLKWLINKEIDFLSNCSFSQLRKKLEWLKWQAKSLTIHLNSTNLIELIGHRTNNKGYWKVPPAGYHWNNSDRKEIRAITCLLTQKKRSKVSGLVAYKTDYLPIADFDRKTFNQAEWTEFEPQLWNWIKVNKRYILWITRTLNGGYHITFKAGIKANSLQNSLFWKGKSRGQLQWGDKYAVSGVSQGYQLFHPQQFLYLVGLIKRTPQPTLNRPKTIRSFNHLGLLMLRLRINLLDNSEPSEWQITIANFFANKKKNRLKRKEYTEYTQKEKNQSEQKWKHQNFDILALKKKIGNSDPPLDSQIAKVVKKVSHFEVKMMISNNRYVENMSFFGGSRTSEYWNISLILEGNRRENFLVDFGHRPELRDKLLNKKVGDQIIASYQTLTNQFGHSANFITNFYEEYGK